MQLPTYLYKVLYEIVSTILNLLHSLIDREEIPVEGIACTKSDQYIWYLWAQAGAILLAHDFLPILIQLINSHIKEL